MKKFIIISILFILPYCLKAQVLRNVVLNKSWESALFFQLYPRNSYQNGPATCYSIKYGNVYSSYGIPFISPYYFISPTNYFDSPDDCYVLDITLRPYGYKHMYGLPESFDYCVYYWDTTADYGKIDQCMEYEVNNSMIQNKMLAYLQGPHKSDEWYSGWEKDVSRYMKEYS